jgi:hypothetical protein
MATGALAAKEGTLMEGGTIYQNSSCKALNGADPSLPNCAAPRIGLPFKVLVTKVQYQNPSGEFQKGFDSQHQFS